MFRIIVEQTSRFSAVFPLSPALRTTLRGRAILVAAVMAFTLALMFAPYSTRANLALCIQSQSESHQDRGKLDSHGARSTQSAQSLAIERCID
ncbi:hypothetical protein M3I53_09520 [Paraburkholderia sp. CNPSo 3272]|uniref:hypothetical protein n=1 Tax=Paraburkholderia sp. CNPSo 3272 TaxID=2940931 RepID=UPI0020B66C5B|nr:hypothetical protein [Paraburkholderia sp. CNPSo 3272]MCP3723371.1 hypothetical protein [Paraburkholderia sp. CNPSo 3272]